MRSQADGAANGSCTNRGFALDDKKAEAMAGRTSFHPRVFGLGGAGEEICLAGGKKKCFSLEGRGTGFSIGAGPVNDGIVEIDPLVLYLTHGDRRPIGFCAAEKGGLVYLEIIVGRLPREETCGLTGKSGEARDAEAPSAGGQRPKHSPVAVAAKLILGDAARGLDGEIDAVVEEREGTEIIGEFANPSEEAQPGGDAVPNECERGPGMQGGDGGERARGLLGDGHGGCAPIRRNTDGTTQNDASGALNRKAEEAIGWEDCPGGDDKAALVEVELDTGVRIDVFDVRGNKVGDPGIDVVGGVVDESSDSTNEGTSVSRSFDVALDGLVDQNEMSLEADRIE